MACAGQGARGSHGDMGLSLHSEGRAGPSLGAVARSEEILAHGRSGVPPAQRAWVLCNFHANVVDRQDYRPRLSIHMAKQHKET